MDLNYSPEDLAFREKTHRWFETNTPRQELKTLAERKAWHRTLYDAGFIGLTWPKEYGGASMTIMVSNPCLMSGAPSFRRTGSCAAVLTALNSSMIAAIAVLKWKRPSMSSVTFFTVL